MKVKTYAFLRSEPSKVFGKRCLSLTLVFSCISTGLGTGLIVWDGSVLLSKYLESSHSKAILGKVVIELGAGTGKEALASISLKAL